MGADGDLCDLVHGPASRVQSELRGTRVHVARSAEPEPELEPELAGFRLFLVGLPVQGGSQGRRGELERAGRWREGLFRLTGIIPVSQFVKEEAAQGAWALSPHGTVISPLS